MASRQVLPVSRNLHRFPRHTGHKALLLAQADLERLLVTLIHRRRPQDPYLPSSARLLSCKSSNAGSREGATSWSDSQIIDNVFALGMKPTFEDAGSKDAPFPEEEEGTLYCVHLYERRTDDMVPGLRYFQIKTPDLVMPSTCPTQ